MMIAFLALCGVVLAAIIWACLEDEETCAMVVLSFFVVALIAAFFWGNGCLFPNRPQPKTQLIENTK